MEPPSSKKPRLSMACNECRRRKVKCDADYPQCRNCRIRNSECYTSDPKRPELPVRREWIDGPERVSQLPHSGYQPGRYHSDRESVPISPQTSVAQSPSLSGEVAANRPMLATTDYSPIHQPYDMSFNLDFNNRFKMLGGSSSQCLSKSLDVYLKSCNVEPVSSLFRHGMKHAEEMEMPLGTPLLSLPDFATREQYLDIYFSRIHTLYPIFEVDETKAVIHHVASIPQVKTLPYDKIPLLVTTHLIMSLGADELAGTSTRVGQEHLQAAASLIGHVIAFPYLTTVQCLLLLAICYRGRNKDGIAWHMVGMAVRTAQSMGLHRYSALRPSTQHGIQRRDQQLFHARIWAICCCLEKIGQLESGRPSSINSVNTDQMMGRDQHPSGPDFLQWNMALAEVQHDISTHLYGHQPGERTAAQILVDAAKLDQQLLAWPTLLPPEFRPGSDIICLDEHFHFAAFLSFQYHQSVIAVHRAALIQPAPSLQQEVDKLMPDNPARVRLKNGETICVGSARLIAKIAIELLDRKLESRLLTAGPGLLACIVLAVYIVKNPGGRMQISDLELLKAVSEWTTAQFLRSGMDERFSYGPSVICERVIQSIARRSKQLSSHSAKEHNVRSHLSSGNSNHPDNSGNTQDTIQSPRQPAAVTPGSLAPILHENAEQQINDATPSEIPRHNSLPTELSGLPDTRRLPVGGESASQILSPNSAMQIPNILLNNTNFDTPGGNLNQVVDMNTPPFEGYNFEDLWNWMLLMGSGDPGGSITRGWADAG